MWKYPSHYSRQFHAHEHATHEEGHEDADKRDTQQQDAIQPRRRRLVRLVKDDEAESSEGEEEGGCQTFHDVLSVDSVLHERHLIKPQHGAGVQQWRNNF